MSYWATGWLCVVVGSLFIAVGGFLTTKGWSEFSNHSQPRRLISSAIRELRQNAKYLKDMDTCSERLPQLDRMYLLPTFHYSAIQTIQTSSLFSDKNAALLDATSSFLYNVNPIDDSIRKLNVIFSDTQPSLQHKKDAYAAFYQSPLLQRFRRRQKELHSEIMKLTRNAPDDVPASSYQGTVDMVSGDGILTQEPDE
ncbi:MAG: hypothetical protein JW955_03955 [Sedimentisphaerales bacterium]|nr:hypothetical protein [Sedimentisphaerales bacterium]